MGTGSAFPGLRRSTHGFSSQQLQSEPTKLPLSWQSLSWVSTCHQTPGSFVVLLDLLSHAHVTHTHRPICSLTPLSFPDSPSDLLLGLPASLFSFAWAIHHWYYVDHKCGLVTSALHTLQNSVSLASSMTIKFIIQTRALRIEKLIMNVKLVNC